MIRFGASPKAAAVSKVPRSILNMLSSVIDAVEVSVSERTRVIITPPIPAKPESKGVAIKRANESPKSSIAVLVFTSL